MTDKQTINRSNLIQELSERYHLPPIVAERLVKTILDAMIHALGKHQRIEIRGFGSFDLRYREPRQARNPKTGEVVRTAGHYAIHFKPGKELKDRVNHT